MDSLAIVMPGAWRPRGRRDGDVIETRARQSGTLHMRARMAVERLDALISAVDARSRCGTWRPAGANSFRDYELLCDAQDLTGWR